MNTLVKHISKYLSHNWRNTALLFFVLLFSQLIISCGKKDTEEDKVHILDKKYISESELFALTKAIDEDPDNSENYFKRSKVYYSRRDYSKALNDVRTAIKLNSEAGKYHLLKSFIFHEMSQPDSALFAAQTAERLNINTSELKFLLAQLHLETGNRAMAEMYIVDAEKIAPTDPQLYYLFGKRYAVDGDTASAIYNFYEAIHLDTTLNLAYKELAGIYLNKRKYDSAMVFVALGKMNDSNEPYYDYIEGRVLEQLNLKASSKALFTKALTADSTFSYAYNALGNILRKEGQDSLAILYFEKEVQFNPYSNASLLNLSQIYEKTNQGNRAIPLLQRVLIKDTTNKNVKASLEKLYVLYPDLKPKPKIDSTLIKKKLDSISVARRIDTAKVKPGTSTPVQQTNPKPTTTTAKPQVKNRVPRIANPDSSKIENRPDTLK